ncbi:MAG TPA: methylmalonyl Co-A mutase-associated GTPase MeaB [Ramlibacter sp.]|uniref:methylmalonyl Co-A mutase-associated GTPase MeaB n=1 Tax=Ramlibacter sp. TaxID=1917967 RepID=UPI002C26DD60|nr:methylmalonyl Co-A mutase-associated GTPase MeaB [Ramlibacter sp.]HVZ45935.1 methylmalonyl Co-A mutase-associated GTPase MeaB [Ramlibacter sp.]
MKTVEDLFAGARAGRMADIARLVSIVENEEAQCADVMRAAHLQAGRATKLGVTGPPGAGKSTLVSVLTSAYRRKVPRVAVVAVDPSSPWSGGAILGDRIRMRDSYLDAGVFIRSMSNRGQSGGLARATRRVVNVLDAVGFDVILVETVGIGQQEIDVASVVDTVCLLTIPGAGDDIQAIKAGVIEIADILVVNKSDRPGAEEVVLDLMQMLKLGMPRNDWRVPVIKTSAAGGTGIEELMDAVNEHRDWAARGGEAQRRNADAMRAEIHALLREQVLRDLAARLDAREVDALVNLVVARELDPYAAVEQLLGR